MKKRLLLVVVALFACGVSQASATPRRATYQKRAPRIAMPRKPMPRVLAKLPNAPPVTARRSAESRRLLAIEYVRQAAVAYSRGDYGRTLALCETASQWYPTYARAHIWKGAAYQKLGRYGQARSSYSWGRALSPDSADAARADRGLKELGYY